MAILLNMRFTLKVRRCSGPVPRGKPAEDQPDGKGAAGFPAGNRPAVSGCLSIEIVRDDQLERQAVRPVGQANADAGLDVPGFPRAIDDAVELMHLLECEEGIAAPDRSRRTLLPPSSSPT